jgi:hypothetical protein
MLLEAIAGISP